MKRACKECGEPKGYQGWSNYETWAVALWIDNEEPTYNEWRERARRALRDAEPAYAGQPKPDAARIALAGQLKVWLENKAPDLKATLWSDLLTAALSEVDVYEIAGHWIEEAAAEVAK